MRRFREEFRQALMGVWELWPCAMDKKTNRSHNGLIARSLLGIQKLCRICLLLEYSIGREGSLPRVGVLHLESTEHTVDVALLMNEDGAVLIFNLNAQE